MYPDREMRLLVVDFSDWHTTIRKFYYCCQTAVFINDLKKISQIAHQYKVIVIGDGVSYAPHGFPNVKELGVDF